MKALLPFIHVNTQWRHAALYDSSLWTTIHLKQTTAALLDVILANAGNRLFTVYVDHRDFGRLAKLWERFDRVEELHYTLDGTEGLTPFITSLGPAPNLKALYLQPGFVAGPIQPAADLPVIFSGCFPSLRSITFSNTIVWPPGVFKGLVSFEYGASEQYFISGYHALDVLQHSPSIESLRLVGFCQLPDTPNPHPIDFPSLVKCTLIGDGTTALIRHLALPATAAVSISKSGIDERGIFPRFDDYSVVPALCALGEVYSISVFVGDCAVGTRAKNKHGGVLDAKVEELYDRSGNPSNFIRFVRSSFDSWRICPGFDTAKEFTLCVERGRIWGTIEANCFAMSIVEFFFNLPSVSVEEAKLLGVPPRELTILLQALCSHPQFKDLCPNLKRLHIETTPLRSPWSLLAGFGRRLADRREDSVPFQSVVVKVRCEMLIPATDHCALLATWDDFVAEGVRLEYERAEVRMLQRCPRRGREDEDEGDEDEGATIVDPGYRCVGWDGWPGNWPKAIGEARAWRTEST